MADTLETPRINDLSLVSDVQATISVNPDLDTGDGLIAEICPGVFEVGGVDLVAQTRFGKFLGSVANVGFAGLRPVTAAEIKAVVNACDEDPSESTQIEIGTVDPEKAWLSFIGNSTLDMMSRVALKLTGKNPALVHPDFGVSDDFLEEYFYRVARVLDPEPVEVERYEYRHDGRLMRAYPQDDLVARIDVVELFGAEAVISEGERDELASTIRNLGDNLDRPQHLQNRAGLVLEPLAKLAQQIELQLAEA